MRVNSMITVSSMPDIGHLLGTSGKREVFDAVNANNASTGIIFGSGNDPFANQFQQFRRSFVNVARDTMRVLDETMAMSRNEDTITNINSEETLLTVPVCMYVPILCHDPIRKMYKDESIYGWGVDEDLVPDNDIYKDTLNFGLIETDPVSNEWPSTYDWKWSSDDPIIADEDKDMIIDSRQYVTNFISEQLQSDLQDPTGYIDGLLIGEIRD